MSTEISLKEQLNYWLRMGDLQLKRRLNQAYGSLAVPLIDLLSNNGFNPEEEKLRARKNLKNLCARISLCHIMLGHQQTAHEYSEMAESYKNKD